MKYGKCIGWVFKIQNKVKYSLCIITYYKEIMLDFVYLIMIQYPHKKQVT